jgi:hypothetical protein
MSYIVIKVYSFACDSPGCDRQIDTMPSYRGDSLLRGAERDLRKVERWTVDGRKHYCPKHAQVRQP